MNKRFLATVCAFSLVAGQLQADEPTQFQLGQNFVSNQYLFFAKIAVACFARIGHQFFMSKHTSFETKRAIRELKSESLDNRLVSQLAAQSKAYSEKRDTYESLATFVMAQLCQGIEYFAYSVLAWDFVAEPIYKMELAAKLIK